MKFDIFEMFEMFETTEESNNQGSFPPTNWISPPFATGMFTSETVSTQC